MEKIDFNAYAIRLGKGKHKRPEDGMCIMECVAYLAGERHSDCPSCACPEITKYAIALNDALRDKERQVLLPFVLRIAGSKASEWVSCQRVCMILDWAIHVVLIPTLHRMAALASPPLKELEAITYLLCALKRGCPRITDAPSAERASQCFAEVRQFLANSGLHVKTDPLFDRLWQVLDYLNGCLAYGRAAGSFAIAFHFVGDCVWQYGPTVAKRGPTRVERVADCLTLLDNMLKLADAETLCPLTPVVETKLHDLVKLTTPA